MKILVSACLLGIGCRYDGESREHPEICRLAQSHQLVPVCPEILGGLPTPRPPAQRRGDRVVTEMGQDVTAQYRRGAEQALRLARLLGCTGAILKQKSPSCGCGLIYDGSFQGRLIPGDGVCAQLLKEHGIPVCSEENIEELLSDERS